MVLRSSEFAVVITAEAQRNLISAFDYIHQRSAQNAAKWLQGAYEKIATLESFPHRYGLAREQKYVPDRNLRQVTYKSHRIIFEIDDHQTVVRVLYVRHGKMRTIGEVQMDDERNQLGFPGSSLLSASIIMARPQFLIAEPAYENDASVGQPLNHRSPIPR
jgi:plasmid stabilization system protein ParE